MSVPDSAGNVSKTPATEAAQAEARDDDDTNEGQSMKLETTMLNRAGNRRVVIQDDDERNYYGMPSSTRAGRYQSPLAWMTAAARVAWETFTGTGSDAERQRDGDDIDDGEAGPMETR